MFLVLEAARVRIAVRWGVFLMTSGLFIGWALVEHEYMSNCRWMRGTTHEAGGVSLDLMPYFANVE